MNTYFDILERTESFFFIWKNEQTVCGEIFARFQVLKDALALLGSLDQQRQISRYMYRIILYSIHYTLALLKSNTVKWGNFNFSAEFLEILPCNRIFICILLLKQVLRCQLSVATTKLDKFRRSSDMLFCFF